MVNSERREIFIFHLKFGMRRANKQSRGEWELEISVENEFFI